MHCRRQTSSPTSTSTPSKTTSHDLPPFPDCAPCDSDVCSARAVHAGMPALCGRATRPCMFQMCAARMLCTLACLMALFVCVWACNAAVYVSDVCSAHAVHAGMPNGPLRLCVGVQRGRVCFRCVQRACCARWHA